jgi:hypothetical protein
MGRFKATVIATVVVLAVAAAVFFGYQATRPAIEDQLIPEALAFTVVDGTPIVRICAPMVISEQELRIYHGDTDYDGTVPWSATGSISLPAGTEFALAEPLDGFVAAGTAPEGFVTTDFAYALRFESGGSAFAVFSRDQPTEGSWTDSSGDPMPVPCRHEPCDPAKNCIGDWPEPTGRATDPTPTFAPTSTPTTAP